MSRKNNEYKRDRFLEILPELCRYIKWTNLNEEEWEKLKNEKNEKKEN